MASDSGTNRLDQFEAYRAHMNRRILEEKEHLGIKRFFNLDSAAYRDGALGGKTRELLGLVASMVLRCNDCIDYHLGQCVEAGWQDDELDDAMSVALLVGGSIVIPHLRHAVETMDLLRAREEGGERKRRRKKVGVNYSIPRLFHSFFALLPAHQRSVGSSVPAAPRSA